MHAPLPWMPGAVAPFALSSARHCPRVIYLVLAGDLVPAGTTLMTPAVVLRCYARENLSFIHFCVGTRRS